MTVIPEANRIIFSGNLKDELKGSLVNIFQLANKLGYQDIILDFSKVTYADAGVMLPICSYCCYYRLNRIEFRIILPENPVLNRLFVNTNWAYLIEPQSFTSNLRRRSNNLPALQFLDGDAQHNVVNKAIEIMMETITVQDRRQLKALEWSLNEITDNVLNHAQSQIGGILQIQCFPARNLVAFYVVDAGLGIPSTLRIAKPSITSDTDALNQAIREGVTRSPTTNQGNGLYGTFKCCEVSGGSFFIKSNNAVLDYGKASFSVKSENVPFRGAFVAATINYTAPRLLDRALVFKGRVHEPANDYIDMHFTHIGDKTIFELEKEVEGFGSRDFGMRARHKVDNILVDRAAAVIFDLSNIPIVSSSFADEVFGKLFASLGPMEFMRRCEFRNVDPTVQRLIDRAIAQRMKVG